MALEICSWIVQTIVRFESRKCLETEVSCLENILRFSGNPDEIWASYNTTSLAYGRLGHLFSLWRSLILGAISSDFLSSISCFGVMLLPLSACITLFFPSNCFRNQQITLSLSQACVQCKLQTWSVRIDQSCGEIGVSGWHSTWLLFV